jgi:phenylalanyl-tRNA synthetase alpha chain
MSTNLQTLVTEAREALSAQASLPEFEAVKARWMGPNGVFTQASKQIGQLPKEEKPAFGKLLNEVKQQLEALFSGKLLEIQQAELQKKIGPAIDPTLPAPDSARGTLHLLTQVRDELVGILKQVGFVVAEGPEIETEYFCFDALNTAPDHPARDLQDTYYLNPAIQLGNVTRKDSERYLMRTHTSTVQIREMLKNQPPLRIISPGRCYRRDTTDATHSASFLQIEALYIDKGVTVKDLKALLDHLVRALLGPQAKTRFRPHFFPYTEPSFEMDFYSAHLGKVGKKWTEMGGCGMVDPAVFEEVGYDPNVWSGYAFGFGIERIAMILYGIDDIRLFYQNDLRFLRQFA